MMRNGFIFKDRHSSEFGVVAKTKSRPVLPEMKSYTFDSPLTDGAYDFSESNEYGHAFYNDRFFEVALQVSADSLRTLETKVSKIAVWLKGSGELIFDDMPLVKWRARVVSELGFVPEPRGKTTVMTVAFRAAPFSECVFDTADGPVIDSVIELDTNIPLDIPGRFIWTVTGGESSYAAAEKTISVINAGNVYASPVIRIKGTVKNISIASGDKTLSAKTSGSGFIIDLKKKTVTDLSGQNVMTSVSGDFFELKAGVSEITVSLYAIGEASVVAEYTPEFVYDFDFDDVDWSESNA